MSLRPALLIVAHPDDEVIGAGALLTRLRYPIIVQITNGAPAGSDPGYAALRAAEAARALAIPRICLGVTDQRASYEIPSITLRVREIIDELNPRFILTHPYEGGHPDHDATACAVHRSTLKPIYEFTSYHREEDHLATGRFLANGARERTWTLSERERTLKQAMFNAYASQREVLKSFNLKIERYRRAPKYDFTRPPHEGRLFYENFDWGIDGARWRAEAARMF